MLTDWPAVLLAILLSLAVGASIGWFLCQQRMRALCVRCQRALKMDEWGPMADDEPVPPQCTTCLFYVLPAGDGWCYMFKEPPEMEGECAQWKEAG